MKKILGSALCLFLAIAPATADAQRRQAMSAEARAAMNARDIAEGQKRMRYLAGAVCPGLESRRDIPGLETPEKQKAIIDARWREAVDRLQGLQDAERQLAATIAQNPTGNIGAAATRERAALDLDSPAIYASAGSALTDWWLAQSVGMRAITAQYGPDAPGPHPLMAYVDIGRSARATLSAFAGKPAFNDYIAPVLNKYDECLSIIQDQVINANASTVRERIPNLKDSASLRALEAKYAVAPGGFDSRGEQNVPVVVGELRTVMAGIVKREEEEAARVRALSDARERARLEQQERENAARIQRELSLARRFVVSARSGDVGGMSAVLHPNVEMIVPQNPTARGKDAVVRMIRDGMSRGGETPRFGDPQSTSRGIVSGVSTSRGTADMFFGFMDGAIITIRVRA